MLTGWRDIDDTVRAFERLERGMDHVFRDWAGRVPSRPRLRTAERAPWPAINAFETKESFIYKAQVPGLGEGDVAVYVEDDVLAIRGERKTDVPEKHVVHLRERPPVAFARKLPLPGRVDGEAVTAAMKDGVLTITLPKAKEALPRQIAVKAL